MSGNEIDPAAEAAVRDMTEAEFIAWSARVRPPVESTDPMERAAQALRRSRGLDRPARATKEQAAAALRDYSAATRSR